MYNIRHHISPTTGLGPPPIPTCSKTAAAFSHPAAVVLRCRRALCLFLLFHLLQARCARWLPRSAPSSGLVLPALCCCLFGDVQVWSSRVKARPGALLFFLPPVFAACVCFVCRSGRATLWCTLSLFPAALPLLSSLHCCLSVLCRPGAFAGLFVCVACDVAVLLPPACCLLCPCHVPSLVPCVLPLLLLLCACGA
jgi:hypothetical protein